MKTPYRRLVIGALGVACLGLTQAAQAQAPAASPAEVRVAMAGAGGKDMGFATITEAPAGVLVHVELTGLTPGWHGMHFHEKGDCSSADFNSAGTHVHDATRAPHGLLNPAGLDKGDLPNIYAGADGAGKAEFYSTLVSLKAAGSRPVLLDADTSALMVHALPDDQKTAGIAGARVGCGVLK